MPGIYSKHSDFIDQHLTPEQVQNIAEKLIKANMFEQLRDLRSTKSQKINGGCGYNRTLSRKIRDSIGDFDKFKKVVLDNKDSVINKTIYLSCIVEMLYMKEAGIEYYQFILDLGHNPNFDRGEYPIIDILCNYPDEKEGRDIADLLYKYGFNVNAANEDGDSCLHTACRRAYVGVKAVKWLLEKKAVHQLNNDGQVPFEDVRYTGTLKYLLEVLPLEYIKEYSKEAVKHASYYAENLVIWLPYERKLVLEYASKLINSKYEKTYSHCADRMKAVEYFKTIV
jgi:hypothetical protein